MRTAQDLTWSKWGDRVSTYLQRLEALLWPDLIILGGGVSQDADHFLPYLTVRPPVVPAELRNDAGIVGAAMAAAEAAAEAAG